MKYILLLILLCLNSFCFAQNAGWIGFDASELVKEIKQVSNNLKVEKILKQQIKDNQELQLKDLQDPWLEEFQRLIKFSIKEDKIEAIKALFNYIEKEYNNASVLILKQMALETILQESKHTVVKEVYYSNNPNAIGFSSTKYTISFDIKFITKYFDLLMTEEIDKTKLKESITNNSTNVSFINLQEVISLIDSY